MAYGRFKFMVYMASQSSQNHRLSESTPRFRSCQSGPEKIPGLNSWESPVPGISLRARKGASQPGYHLSPPGLVWLDFPGVTGVNSG
jgi:hypothetical protein